MLITIPGIAITMTAESLLRSFRNAHHDHFGIAITVPRNPHKPGQLIISRSIGSPTPWHHFWQEKD
jgi:hypothetical protein